MELSCTVLPLDKSFLRKLEQLAFVIRRLQASGAEGEKVGRKGGGLIEGMPGMNTFTDPLERLKSRMAFIGVPDSRINPKSAKSTNSPNS